MHRRSLSTTIALTIGIFLAASLSVYATSLGTNLSVTGNVGVGTNVPRVKLDVAAGDPLVGASEPIPTNGGAFIQYGKDLGTNTFGWEDYSLDNPILTIMTPNGLIAPAPSGNGIHTALLIKTQPWWKDQAIGSAIRFGNNSGDGTGAIMDPGHISDSARIVYFGSVGQDGGSRLQFQTSGGTPVHQYNAGIKMYENGTVTIGNPNDNGIPSPSLLSVWATTTPATVASIFDAIGLDGSTVVFRIANSGNTALSSFSVSTTTATSTFSTGGLTVGANKFVVQQTSGNVGIATTSPWRTLSVSGTLALSSSLTTGTTGNYLCINTTNYEITSGTTCSASSERFKDNIKPIPYGLESILKLSPVSFTYKKEYNPDPSTKLGLIAEQVDQFIPELVAKDKDNKPESVDYAKLTPVLIRAIQEQDAKISALLLNQNTDAIIHDGITIKQISSNLGTWSIDQQGTLNAVRVVAKSVEASDRVCIGKTCLTENELKNLLAVKEGNFSSVAATPVPVPTPASLPPPSPEPTPAPSPQTVSSSSPEVSDTGTSTQTANTSSVTEQPSPLFDVGTQPVSGTSSSKYAVTVIIAAIMLALGAVVLVWRRGYRG